jgi:hypothetical protein
MTEESLGHFLARQENFVSERTNKLMQSRKNQTEEIKGFFEPEINQVSRILANCTSESQLFANVYERLAYTRALLSQGGKSSFCITTGEQECDPHIPQIDPVSRQIAKNRECLRQLKQPVFEKA